MILRKCRYKGAALVLIAALATPSILVSDPVDPPWCLPSYNFPGEPFLGPEGAVTQVGEVSFRVCKPGSPTSTPETRVLRMRYNPDRVPDLAFERSMIGLMVNPHDFRNHVEHTKLGHVMIDARRFGGLAYDEYRFFSLVKKTWSPARRFLYEAGDGADIPTHLISCGSDLNNLDEEGTSCHIIVGYKGLTAHLLFIGGGPDFDPGTIPVDDFPIHAKDIIRILEAADMK